MFLWPCLGGKVPGSFEAIGSMAPWHHAAGTDAWDILSADGALQFYAWRDLVFDGWHRGQIPLWNPYQLCGTPLLANGQSAPFYPLHILMGLLGVPTGIAIVLLAWFHMALSGLGARRFACALGANGFGATLSGLFFSLSVYMVAWTPLPSVGATVAWSVWAMSQAVLVCRSPSWKSGAILAVFVGLMMLAGHLQIAAYGLIGVGLTAMCSLFLTPKFDGKACGLLVGGVVLGLALASVQLLPTYMFGQHSHRKTPATEKGWHDYSLNAVQPFEWAGVVFPGFLGVPHVAEPDSGAQKISTYWPQYVKSGAHLAESAITLGPAVLILLGLLKVRGNRRRLLVLGALGAAGLLLITGPLSQVLYFGVPGWASTGSPGRAAFLLVLACCMGAGLAFPFDEEKKPPLSLLMVGGLFIASVMLLQSVAGQATGQAGAIVSTLTSRRLLDAMPYALGALLFGVGCVLAWPKLNRYGRFTMLAVCQLVAVTVVSFPAGEAPYVKAVPDPMVRSAFVNSGWGFGTVPNALMPPDTATSSRQYDVGGYDSLMDRDTVALLRDINGADAAPPTNGNIMHIKPGFKPDLLAGVGVSKVYSLRPLPQLATTPVNQDGVLAYDLPGKRFEYDGEVTKVDDGLDHQTVQLQGAGTTLTVHDRLMAGWTAVVDGHSVAITGSPWRTVALPGAGSHTVVFSYSPPGFFAGLIVSVLALVACIAAIVLDRRSKPLS